VDTTASRGVNRWARVVAIAAGILFVGGGVWAMAASESFFDVLGPFPPYNQHFVQDVGAFQIGLGAVLLIAAFSPRADILAAALLGVGIGSVAHVVSHVLGIDLGGRPALDIPALTALAVVLLVAGVVRWRASRPTS
jgi:uncharacterized membrane protein